MTFNGSESQISIYSDSKSCHSALRLGRLSEYRHHFLSDQREEGLWGNDFFRLGLCYISLSSLLTFSLWSVWWGEGHFSVYMQCVALFRMRTHAHYQCWRQTAAFRNGSHQHGDLSHANVLIKAIFPKEFLETKRQWEMKWSPWACLFLIVACSLCVTVSVWAWQDSLLRH